MNESNSKLLVVALGGNAITLPGSPPDIPNQFRATAVTAKSLADLIDAGHHLVITHGNGPQVGKVTLEDNTIEGSHPVEDHRPSP